MTDKCAMIASFRKGKGSASAFGANVAGLIKDNCDKGLERWKDVAEHIGHDEREHHWHHQWHHGIHL